MAVATSVVCYVCFFGGLFKPSTGIDNYSFLPCFFVHILPQAFFVIEPRLGGTMSVATDKYPAYEGEAREPAEFANFLNAHGWE